MQLDTIRKITLKAFCRLDDISAEEEELLYCFYDAAVGYMSQAGVREPPECTPRRAQYDLCVNYLVLDSWDRRDISFVGDASSENPARPAPPPQPRLGCGGACPAVRGGWAGRPPPPPDRSVVFDGEDTSGSGEEAGP